MEFDLNRKKAMFDVGDILLGYPDELPLTLASLQAMRAVNKRESEAAKYRKKHGFPGALAMNAHSNEHENAIKRRQLTEQFEEMVVGLEVQCLRLELDAYGLDNEGPGLGQE